MPNHDFFTSCGAYVNRAIMAMLYTHSKKQKNILKMKVLKRKPSAQFTYNYSINVLSKCSNIISHRPSKAETSTIDLRRSTLRSSKVSTLIIDLRRSTHQSMKVDTSIFEGQHIDLRRSTHRFSKIEAKTSHRQPNITLTIRHGILSTMALHSIISYDSV